MKFNLKLSFSCGRLCKLLFGFLLIDDEQTKIQWSITKVCLSNEDLLIYDPKIIGCIDPLRT